MLNKIQKQELNRDNKTNNKQIETLLIIRKFAKYELI